MPWLATYPALLSMPPLVFSVYSGPMGFGGGDLTADSTLESDWLLLLLWLYPPQAGVWNPPDRDRVNRAAQSILGRQLPDGGFSIYPSGPSDVSASVKAYFALKLSGEPLDSEPMTRLRERILALGGIRAANSYVKINLSLFNLYPRDRVPTVPPEIVLLGKLLYQMSSWTRAIIVPLSIVQALDREGRPVPAGFTLEELFLPASRSISVATAVSSPGRTSSSVWTGA